MKHIKNQPKIKYGFALIEVLLTVSLIAIVLTSIFSLQSNLFNSIFKRHSAVERIFRLRNMFVEYELINKFIEEASDKILAEENLADPRMAITFSAKNVADKNYPFLYRLDALGKWQGLFKPSEELVIGMLFSHLPKEEEKQPEAKKNTEAKKPSPGVPKK